MANHNGSTALARRHITKPQMHHKHGCLTSQSFALDHRRTAVLLLLHREDFVCCVPICLQCITTLHCNASLRCITYTAMRCNASSPECDFRFLNFSVLKLFHFETFPFFEWFRYQQNFIVEKSIRLGIVKILYRKKFQFPFLLRFWVRWVRFRFQNFSVSKLFHFIEGIGFGIEENWYQKK